MRKHLLLIIAITSFTFSYAQTDTVILKSGRVVTGKYYANHIQCVELISGSLQDHLIIPKDSIASLKLNVTHKLNGESFVVSVKDNKNLDGFAPPKKFKNYNTHLRKAGVTGITGVLLTVVGSGLSTIGAITATPALTYGGAGLAGVGGILNIVSIANLIPASKYKTPKLVEF
jgi:hypothetical protein